GCWARRSLHRTGRGSGRRMARPRSVLVEVDAGWKIGWNRLTPTHGGQAATAAPHASAAATRSRDRRLESAGPIPVRRVVEEPRLRVTPVPPERRARTAAAEAGAGGSGGGRSPGFGPRRAGGAARATAARGALFPLDRMRGPRPDDPETRDLAGRLERAEARLQALAEAMGSILAVAR